MSPANQVRDALEGYLRGVADDAIQRGRGDAGVRHEARAARHAWLGAAAAEDALGEAESLGVLGVEARGALRAHVARTRVEAAMAPARDALWALRHRDVVLPDARWTLASAVARWPVASGAPRRQIEAALLRVASEARPRMADALAEAAERHRPGAQPDAGPSMDALVALAEDILAVTDDAAAEIAASMEATNLGELLCALRAPELDALFPPRGRWRRVAGDVAGLGLERELGARVRVEGAHGGITPRVRVVPREPPRDVRLLPCATDHGLVSELAAAEGLGRALAVALSSAGLPVELRWPLEGTVPRALGTAFAQILAHRGALNRGRGIEGREREWVERRVRAMLVLETRACAASVRVWATAGAEEAQHRELAAELLRRALKLEVDPRVAPWLTGTPWGAPARLRGRVGGLAAWYALRERYDEDWYRNPRAEEAIRAGAHPGGGQSVEAWLADLGAPPDAHRLRLQELASGQ